MQIGLNIIIGLEEKVEKDAKAYVASLVLHEVCDYEVIINIKYYCEGKLLYTVFFKPSK